MAPEAPATANNPFISKKELLDLLCEYLCNSADEPMLYVEARILLPS